VRDSQHPGYGVLSLLTSIGALRSPDGDLPPRHPFAQFVLHGNEFL
jgi:hypothetical protein